MAMRALEASSKKGSKEINTAGVTPQSVATMKYDAVDQQYQGLVEYLQDLETITVKTANFVSSLISRVPLKELEVTNSVDVIFNDIKTSYIEEEVGALNTFLQLQVAAISDPRTASSNMKIFNGLANDANGGSVLRLDQITQIIHESSNAAKRCRTISPAHVLANNIAMLWDTLLEHISAHLSQSLDSSSSTQSSKNEPNLAIFGVVQSVTLIMHKIQTHFENDMFEAIQSSISIRVDCIKKKEDLLQTLEQRLLRALESALKAIILHIKFLLENTQKSSDYKIKDHHTFDGSPTQASVLVVNFITKIANNLNPSLYGKNKEVFVTEFATTLYSVILAHLKNYPVTYLGGLKLTKDLDMYQEAIEKFHTPSVSSMYIKLRRMGNVLLVSPENLPDVIQQTQEEGLPMEDVVSFLKLRHDYRSIKLPKDLLK